MTKTGLNLVGVIIDPNRLQYETSVDADVIARLHKDGDVSTVIRPVDVDFVGTEDNLLRLARDLRSGEWTVVGIEPYQDSFSLHVRVNMNTEPASVRQLTETALRIEVAYNVRSDGWGTFTMSCERPN
ncbi:ribonuclease E inhibitor RraB [Phyllobacterium myrsinacearum]|uniref:Regulator of ribonuclease activity B domain-containing protein n=1 Tax=Phyllobacterium myrsinacearum TaxID=28101 RepID=A0A839EN65_9HYPH|nr:ribonuclease E inhibitor RraB [Phyllobacterium myrsinacearum]MBA8882033.1 hypothetical protein [Phyllobacterium myrsinacearum]